MGRFYKNINFDEINLHFIGWWFILYVERELSRLFEKLIGLFFGGWTMNRIIWKLTVIFYLTFLIGGWENGTRNEIFARLAWIDNAFQSNSFSFISRFDYLLWPEDKRMTTGERLQNSITETIRLYKEELRRERVALNAMLKRTNCESDVLYSRPSNQP